KPADAQTATAAVGGHATTGTKGPMGKTAASTPARDPAAPPQPDPIQRMAESLKATQNTIVVEGYASTNDRDKNAASLERANKLRDQLVRNGVDPNKVVALG